MSKGEKIVFWVLGILNVLFLVYWFGLSFNYRMHYDDVHFMADLQDVSIWEFVKMRYMDVGGNFGTYIENAIVDKIALWVGDYRIWPMVFYGLGIWMSYAVAKFYLKNIKPVMLFTSVVAIYNIYVLTSIDLAVFTWLCAMAYYLFGPMLFLLISYLNRDKIEWWRWGILGMVAFYIAGASVSFSPVVLSVMFVNGMWLWKKHGWNVKDTWDDVRVKRIVGVAIVMVALVGLVMIAPGNYARLELMEDEFKTPTTILSFLSGIGNAFVTYCYFMFFYLPYHLLILCIGIILGARSNIKLPASKIKIIFLCLGVFIGYLLLSTLPLVYLYGGFGIYRPYCPVCYMQALLFAAIGYVLGVGCTKDRLTHAITIVLGVMMMVVMSVNIYLDFPIMQAYAKAHDDRKAYLLKLQAGGNTETVCVESYPSSAVPDSKYWIMKVLGKSAPLQPLYYEADTGEMPTEYERHTRNYLDLDFDFIICK